MKALRAAAAVLLVLPLGGCIAMIGMDGEHGLEKRIEKLEKRIGELEKGPAPGQVIFRSGGAEIHGDGQVVPATPK